MASTVTVKSKRTPFPSRVEVRVGILDEGISHDGGLTVGDLAEIHEFGLGNVPARAPIRVFFDENEDELRQLAAALFQRAAEDGRFAAFDRAAKLVAVKAAALLRNTITEGLEPDLAASTKRRKTARGYSPPYTPLVETGVLRNSYAGDAEVTR